MILSIINIRKVPRKELKISLPSVVNTPQDHANVNEREIMFDPSIELRSKIKTLLTYFFTSAMILDIVAFGSSY